MISGGSSSQRSQSSSQTMPWQDQMGSLRNLFSGANNWLSGPAAEYGRNRQARFDPSQARAMAAIDEKAYNDPNNEAAQEYSRSLMAGERDDVSKNPHVQAMFNQGAEQMGDAFNRDVMSTLNTRFAGAGRTQQDRGMNAQTAAAGRAQGQFARGLGTLSSGLYNNAYNQVQGQKTAALQMAPQTQAMNFAGLNQAMGVGGARQQQSQQQLSDFVNRFQFGQNQPLQRLGQYQGLLGAPIMTREAQGTSSGDSMNFGLFSSDRRLKKNIRLVGETPSGIPTYTFEYKDERPGTYHGVMAQDLLESRPDAVGEMPDGSLGVYYSRIDAEHQRI
jgi:hypothetical protein